MINALSDEKKAEYLKEIPLGRFGKAEEVAAVVSMLTKDELSYITGQVITMDGGISL
jgi:3-oxoacyl-[acyl-carrier protein] reductase